ncbi:MAG: hypothetical protein IPN86_14985 [Saprospiraceae bacterium]|nr:hypothetical protein [Saprospiraceae bacterium]
MLHVGPDGVVKVTLQVLLHILPSVTVTVYVPAPKPVAVCAVCAGVVLHA